MSDYIVNFFFIDFREGGRESGSGVRGETENHGSVVPCTDAFIG